MGFLVSAELRIIPAKKYVKLRYEPVHKFDDLVKVFSKETKTAGNDFVEALQYSENEAVVMTGNLTDECESDKVGNHCTFGGVRLLLADYSQTRSCHFKLEH